MIKLTKREVFKLNKNLKIDKVLNDVADVVVKDIKDGIVKYEEDINGTSFTPLSDYTKNFKKKKGYRFPDKPLYAKGKMKNVYVKRRAVGDGPAVIATNEAERPGIGRKHQEGDEVPQRQWFGISKRTKTPISNVAKHHIRKALMK
tara:strand:- start:7758 stop:8195 length:438 start_codon:yes stop_codon:yes gene_type:complete